MSIITSTGSSGGGGSSDADPKDFFFEVASGQISGARSVKHSSLGDGIGLVSQPLAYAFYPVPYAKRDLHSLTAILDFDVLGVSLAVSTQSNDNGTLSVKGLDFLGNAVTATATLNGQTAVNLSTTIDIVHEVTYTPGNTTNSLTTVYLYGPGFGAGSTTGGVPDDLNAVRAIVTNKNLKSYNPYYRVPAGKNALISNLVVSKKLTNLAKFSVLKFPVSGGGSIFFKEAEQYFSDLQTRFYTNGSYLKLEAGDAFAVAVETLELTDDFSVAFDVFEYDTPT